MSKPFVFFGKFAIPSEEVFLSTALTVGLVNIKPIVPGRRHE